jgi:hypothetical protein
MVPWIGGADCCHIFHNFFRAMRCKRRIEGGQELITEVTNRLRARRGFMRAAMAMAHKILASVDHILSRHDHHISQQWTVGLHQSGHLQPRYAHSGVGLPPAGDYQHTDQHLRDRAYEHRYRGGNVHFERRGISIGAVREVVPHELLGAVQHARSSTVRLVCGNINGQQKLTGAGRFAQFLTANNRRVKSAWLAGSRPMRSRI